MADPVGGTRAKLWVWNNETQAEYQRSEPLGQSITENAPPEDGFENYSAYKGNVGEPEWQCEIPKNTWGSFSEMPWHCQRNAMERAGIDLPYKDEKTRMIIFAASTHSKKKSPFSNQSDPPAYDTGKLSAKLSKFALKATNKDSGSERIGPDPSEVTIKIPPVPPVLPDDLAKRLDAANGGDDDQPKIVLELEFKGRGAEFLQGLVSKYLDEHPECERFINKLISQLSKDTRSNTNGKDVRAFLNDFASNGRAVLAFWKTPSNLDGFTPGGNAGKSGIFLGLTDKWYNKTREANFTSFLREFIHWAGASLGAKWGDDTVSRSLFNLGGMKISFEQFVALPHIQQALKTTSYSPFVINSTYWNPSLMKACGSSVSPPLYEKN